MEKKDKLTATVLSPSKEAHKRIGRGFSLSEIKKSGKSIESLKRAEIKIDYSRKSAHQENIDVLKKLTLPAEKKEKRKPFTPKDKKRTEFKAKDKKKAKPVKKKLPVKKKPIEKPKAKPKVKAPEKEAPKDEKIPLTSLSGLGPATAKKFEELGVDCVEELVQETAEEIAPLIKGASEERIANWIAEGKELLK